MTLSFALNHAVSGLAATSSQADVIANNIANALTEGYGRREVALSSAVAGGAGVGVRVEGIVRATSPAVTEARRGADAAEGAALSRASVMERLATVIGEPGDPEALATLADRMDDAFSAAADTPESAVTLKNASQAAGDYVGAINRASQEAMTLRAEMDASIAQQVDTLNASLTQVQSLNREIKAIEIGGGDTSALQDQRERVLRSISDILPIRAIPREFGSVALYSQTGGQLLDGRVFPLGFEASPGAGQGATVENGGLSRLTTSGTEIDVGQTDNGLFDGGTLSAAFRARDTELPAILTSLDALAGDLMLRTQGLPQDATTAPGDPGLFTDGGAAFDIANLTGAAARLSLNAAVDEAKGGDVTRLRDGLGAVAPGTEGDARLLRGIQDALTAPRAIGAGNLTGARGVASFAAAFSGALLADAANAATDAATESGRADGLRATELEAVGVDTDQQLSHLLQVEQAFAANARVVEVVDTLMQRLLQI